jgi:hypothetical protein
VGDGFTTWNIWQNQHKPWVRNMAIPAVCVFGIATLTSVGTLVRKVVLFASVRRHASRNSNHAADAVVLVGGVEVAGSIAQHPAIRELKEQFEENVFEINRIGCTLLLAALEGALVSASAFEPSDGSCGPSEPPVQLRFVCRRAHVNALCVLSHLVHR